MEVRIGKAERLSGVVTVPGDKSLSHRALLFGSLAKGTSELTGLSDGEDVASTGRCMRDMGVSIESDGNRTIVRGAGIRGLKAPGAPLDCGNSGSTMRMLMGILAGQSFSSTMIGDASLSRRPMKRVAEPLEKMGAKFQLTNGSFAPVGVTGVGKLRAIQYDLKVASAQVKSAILLAALYGEGRTIVTGEIGSRDHTERLFPHFGVSIDVSPEAIALVGGQELRGAKLAIPGDPSSAAFWVAAACISPGGRVTIPNVLLNPTRTGFLQALKRMGADIRETVTSTHPEPVGDVVALSGPLRGVTISPEEVPSLIDELPVFAVLAAYAHGVTEVRGAEELRVKETDRIDAIARNLRSMGGKIETFSDGFRIEGPQRLLGAHIDSLHDHRIAMAFAIAALGCDGENIIGGAEAANVSYPAFFKTLERLKNAGS